MRHFSRTFVRRRPQATRTYRMPLPAVIERRKLSPVFCSILVQCRVFLGSQVRLSAGRCVPRGRCVCRTFGGANLFVVEPAEVDASRRLAEVFRLFCISVFLLARNVTRLYRQQCVPREQILHLRGCRASTSGTSPCNVAAPNASCDKRCGTQTVRSPFEPLVPSAAVSTAAMQVRRGYA